MEHCATNQAIGVIRLIRKDGQIILGVDEAGNPHPVVVADMDNRPLQASADAHPSGYDMNGYFEDDTNKDAYYNPETGEDTFRYDDGDGGDIRAEALRIVNPITEHVAMYDMEGSPVDAAIHTDRMDDMLTNTMVDHIMCTYCGVKPYKHKCNTCKAVGYCGRTCQSQDWAYHKKTCTEKPTICNACNHGKITIWCTRCHNVGYCCDACMRRDVVVHRKTCYPRASGYYTRHMCAFKTYRKKAHGTHGANCSCASCVKKDKAYLHYMRIKDTKNGKELTVLSAGRTRSQSEYTEYPVFVHEEGPQVAMVYHAPGDGTVADIGADPPTRGRERSRSRSASRSRSGSRSRSPGGSTDPRVRGGRAYRTDPRRRARSAPPGNAYLRRPERFSRGGRSSYQYLPATLSRDVYARYGRFQNAYGRRQWYRPGLFQWFWMWGLLNAHNRRRYDPVYDQQGGPIYFDPVLHPRIVDRQLKAVMARRTDLLSDHVSIVPNYDRGQFMWARGHGSEGESDIVGKW